MRNGHFSLLDNLEDIICGHVRKFVMLSIIFWTIYLYIRFGSKLYRQIVGIPMGTNFAPLIADCFCFVMRETSCSLFLKISRLMLLKQLTLP